MTTLTLDGLKPLTLVQYDGAKEAALRRVAKRVGDKPTRRQFQRELSPLWTVLDAIALVVFIAALVISSVHIISHMGALAASSYKASAAGMVIDKNAYVLAHQLLMIFLSEGSMILFLVMFGLSPRTWRKGVYLGLAGLAVVFVLVANVQSGIGTLESFLAPAFTIGIGLKLEHLLTQQVKRREEVDKAYQKALDVWEKASADSTTHPDYPALLKQEIWAALLKKNPAYADAPPGFKWAAVERETAREKWAYEAHASQDQFQGEAERKPPVPFGSTAPVLEPDAPEFGQMIVSANGHGSANGHSASGRG